MIDWFYNWERIQKENEAVFLKKTTVRLEWFLLNEIILREDFGRVYNCLEEIYATNPEMIIGFRKRDLDKIFSDIHRTWGSFLPLIGKKSFPWVMAMNLPKSIKFLKIKIDKICSDFITLQILVLVEDEVNDDFNKIVSSYHYPEKIEHYNIPWKWSGYSLIDCQRRKRKDVRNFLDNLKKESLIFLESIIWLWEFFKMQNDDWFDNFPIINIFSYLWDKEELISNRGYLDVIGFTYNPVDTYKYEDKYLLSLHDAFIYDSDEVVFSLLIDQSKFKNYGVDFSPYWALDDFNFYMISLYEWLYVIQTSIDKIVNSILSASDNFDFISVKKEELIRLFIIFDRLKNVVSHMRIRSAIFERIEKIWDLEPSLEKMYLNMSKHFMETQDPIIKHTKENINSLFDLQNSKINIKSQRVTWRFTIVIFVLTVVQVLLLEYDQGKHVYSFVWDGVRYLLSAIF